MGTVLYEVGFQFEFASLILLFLMIGFPLLLKLKWRELPIVVKCVFSIACVFVWVISILVFVFQYDMYTTVTNAYKTGQYEVVEGYVENFHALPPEGHDVESFEIDGVYFSYSDAKIITGYHNAKKNGGVITGDGQYLKIGYIYYDDLYGNIIVYIEEIDVEGHT